MEIGSVKWSITVEYNIAHPKRNWDCGGQNPTLHRSWANSFSAWVPSTTLGTFFTQETRISACQNCSRRLCVVDRYSFAMQTWLGCWFGLWPFEGFKGVHSRNVRPNSRRNFTANHTLNISFCSHRLIFFYFRFLCTPGIIKQSGNTGIFFPSRSKTILKFLNM